LLGDFRILEKLGEGGMGVVFLARDERLERRVALKVVAPHLAQDQEFRQRFVTEARSAAAIDHPNVVTVYTAGTIDDTLYLAMRYVKGTDLRVTLHERGALQPEVAVTVLEEVGAALDTAHAAGLVHRDVKPGNILLEGPPGAGTVYLTDFGLTKGSGTGGLTGTGQWVGTIDYVAPEQIQGNKIDARSDVYALGCVLYEMLTGSVPFSGNDMQKMWGHVNEAFPALSESANFGDNHPLAAVIERATAKDPANRFPSAGDLARAARAALKGEEVGVPEASVATGAAAKGLAEEAPTRKLSQPRLAPTVTGRSPVPPPRRPAARPATAPAAPSGGSSSSRTAAIIGGAVVIAAGLLAAAVVIAGSGGGPNQPAATTSPTTTAKPGTQSATNGTRTPRQPTLPPGSSPCNAAVSVKASTTSCPFGINVARAFHQSGGASVVEAYSPVTGLTYTMSCSGTSPTVCTGGDNAVVYILS
jgi:serine/threonine protein kinase